MSYQQQVFASQGYYGPNSAALALDAADGVIDGKIHGSHIVQGPAIYGQHIMQAPQLHYSQLQGQQFQPVHYQVQAAPVVRQGPTQVVVQNRVVEVPHVQEIIRHVPKVTVQEVQREYIRHVPKIETQIREEIRHVPVAQYVDQPYDVIKHVPKVVQVEQIRHVPQVKIVDVDRPYPVHKPKIIDQYYDVPKYVDTPVEVPVIKHVQVPVEVIQHVDQIVHKPYNVEQIVNVPKPYAVPVDVHHGQHAGMYASTAVGAPAPLQATWAPQQSWAQPQWGSYPAGAYGVPSFQPAQASNQNPHA